MPMPMLQVGAALLCPHGGSISILPAGARVTSDGAPLANIVATGVVAGCGNNNPAAGLVPCTTVTWVLGASRVTIQGAPALLSTSLAVFNCVPPLAGVPATVVSTQQHATGT